MPIRNLLFFIILILTASCAVKKPKPTPIRLTPIKINSKSKAFRSSPDKIIEIIHTELNVSFDWKKHLCFGEEKIILTPYFYSSDSFYLDAKNFIFDKIALTQNNKPILFRKTYDNKKLVIYPNRKLVKSDTLILSLKYTAQPDKNISNGSKAIKDDKGLYFINTDLKEPYKPMQIWTQGETESNSNWFATIDKPYEKMTFDINITVPDTMTTLSNGALIKSTKTGNNRTDFWSIKKPMSAYLVMMAIGEFQKTTDHWNGKEVNYYLEKKYHNSAKKIFNHTPEMLEFFSKKIGYSYPWNKYSQVVVHDYVSGAMENTSASLFGEFVQKNDRELLDNPNDGIVAHELFHQWFGDLVTCASWSHLTLNEGFATFGEQLWYAHKYGKTAELKRIHRSMNSYLNYSKRNDKSNIRFHYRDKEDMFNSITYQKGARALNLLKFEIGEKAFFAGIKNYLHKYQFKNTQIENLRNELENVSGKDLRFFFKQWFLDGGHPEVDFAVEQIDSNYYITINQTQKKPVFQFPFQYRINNQVKTIQCKKRKTKINLPKNITTPIVYPDPNGIFLGRINNELMTKDNLISYYKTANNYLEKIRIIESIKTKKDHTTEEDKLLMLALNDDNPDLSHLAMKKIEWSVDALSEAKEDLKRIATLSSHSNQKSQAIYILSAMNDKLLFTDFTTWSNDPSYKVAGAALYAIKKLKPQEALHIAQNLEPDAEAELFSRVVNVYGEMKDSTSTYFKDNLMKRFGGERIKLINNYAVWAKRFGPTYQNEYWQIVSERATNDEQAWTRLAAIYSLNNFSKKNKNISEKQKEDLKTIIKNETDPKVIFQLKVNKLRTEKSLKK